MAEAELLLVELDFFEAGRGDILVFLLLHHLLGGQDLVAGDVVGRVGEL